MIDQEFSKKGPNHGSGTKQNEETLKRNVKLAFVCNFNVFLYKIQDML